MFCKVNNETRKVDRQRCLPGLEVVRDDEGDDPDGVCRSGSNPDFSSHTFCLSRIEFDPIEAILAWQASARRSSTSESLPVNFARSVVDFVEKSQSESSPSQNQVLVRKFLVRIKSPSQNQVLLSPSQNQVLLRPSPNQVRGSESPSVNFACFILVFSCQGHSPSKSEGQNQSRGHSP